MFVPRLTRACRAPWAGGGGSRPLSPRSPEGTASPSIPERPEGLGAKGSPEHLRTRSKARRLRGAPGGSRHWDPPTPPQSHRDKEGVARGHGDAGDTVRGRPADKSSGHGWLLVVSPKVPSAVHGLLRRSEAIAGCCGSCARSRLSPSSGDCSKGAPGRAPSAGLPHSVWREGSQDWRSSCAEVSPVTPS